MFADEQDFDKWCIAKDIAIHCPNCDYPTYPMDIMHQVKRRILPSPLCYNCDSLTLSMSRNVMGRYYAALEIAQRILNCEHEWATIQHLVNRRWSW